MAKLIEALSSTPLPVPGIEPRGVTLDEFMTCMPEKLGIVAGDVIDDDPAEIRSRCQMLALLLVNTGLVEAVKLAPRADWAEALERAYGRAH